MTRQTELDRWTPLASRLKTVPVRNVSLPTLMRAARTVAKFVRQNWEPTTDRPGLRDAGPRMSLTIADELDSLADAIAEARSRYRGLFRPESEVGALLDQGAVLLRELMLVIDWQLDEIEVQKMGPHKKLLEDLHHDPESAEELAAALRDYAAVAHLYRDQLLEVPGYNPALPTQAGETARRLEILAEDSSTLGDERMRILALVERIAHLIQSRLRLVRQAAAYVFRERDDLLRQVQDFPHELERAAQHRAAVVMGNRNVPATAKARAIPHPQPIL